MKNIFIIALTINFCFTASSQISFCENFDNYIVGDPIAQTSENWNTWGELMTGANPALDDANVVNTQFYSGDNSLYLSETIQPIPDIVLIFDTVKNLINYFGVIQPDTPSTSVLSAPYNSGVFEYSHMMYVVPNKTGYFNFQSENVPGTQWALEVNLDANGGIVMSNTSGTSFNCSYPGTGMWFEIKFHIDLSNNIWEVFIDGVSQGFFSNPINQISSLDLYPGVNSEYYIDDVCFNYDPTPIQLPNRDLALLNINSISGLAGQNRDVSVEVINLGLTSVNSFDIEFDYNGNIITENITGINIPMLSTYTVNFSNTISLVGGNITSTAILSNVNSLGLDDNPTNDTFDIQINSVVPTPNKLVIGEEATGTWCGWCPRGAVALNFMDRDYYGYFQGIAVHNGDPMTNVNYDAGLAPYIGGYPSGLVNRGTEVDPSDFLQEFMQEITNPISATFSGNANSNVSGTTIFAEIITTINTNISGNWKFACVLVEDSVTGIGGTWYQSNSYGSQGISLIDVDGVDWGTLPNWVPDVDMIYRHVGRDIQPSFDGENLENSSYLAGDQLIHNFEFILDPSWDVNKMHVIGMLIDPTGKIDNAVSLPVGILTSNFIEPNNHLFEVYPNPSYSTTTLKLILDSENDVLITLRSLEGKIISQRNYREMIGSYSMKLNLENISSGVYFIEAQIGSEVIVKKLFKN